MKRALALSLAIAVAGFGTAAQAAGGPQVIGSVYLPSVDTARVGSLPAGSANPDGLLLDIRQPVGRQFWVGAQLATNLNSDQIAPGVDAQLGTCFSVNLGLQAEFSHYVSGYAYVGYGGAKVEASGPGAQSGSGNGVDWGIGAQLRMANSVFADVGYTSLFDGDLDVGSLSVSTTIAGPHVGIGYQF